MIHALTGLAVVACASAAFADVTWDAVKGKITGAKDYTLVYKYEGPKGNFKFDYKAAPPKIRTEILEAKSDPSKAGTVSVYDPGALADKVRFKTGGGTITRNLTHKDVVGTAFANPIFTLILDAVKGITPTTKADGDKTQFSFKTGTGTYSIWANKDAEITRTERIDGRDREVRDFSNVKFNVGPKIDF